MAVIAINQQHGSRGADLGRLVADRLEYRFFRGEDLIAETARIYKVSAEQIKKVADERQPHFWERLTTDVDRLVAFFRAVVLKEMAADRMVIVGRWLGLLMPEGACGLRVRTAAPFADRVRQAALEEELDHGAAERRVREHDREVRARTQHLFGVDINDPAIYSLVLNSGSMPLEALATTLAACAQYLDRNSPEGIHRIRDAAIEAQVRAHLLADPMIGSAQVRVQCKGGSVQVSGIGLVPPWDQLVEQVARQVEGVASVEVAVEEPPIPPRSG